VAVASAEPYASHFHLVPDSTSSLSVCRLDAVPGAQPRVSKQWRQRQSTDVMSEHWKATSLSDMTSSLRHCTVSYHVWCMCDACVIVGTWWWRCQASATTTCQLFIVLPSACHMPVSWRAVVYGTGLYLSYCTYMTPPGSKPCLLVSHWSRSNVLNLLHLLGILVHTYTYLPKIVKWVWVVSVVMDALWNRAGHYIFALWFLLSSFFLLFFFLA